ncbi:MAG TPA: molybdopterin-dependent oxidoreductase [Myxococcota bacterium]|nr:molybdopterin-dependent oxidoreductase [Myxococcota bacterium]
MPTSASFCRICHNACPVLATVEDGRLVGIRGDFSNPLYEGFTCVKGRAAPELHNRPERLRHSLKRGDDGSFARIPVEQAMDEIAAKLRRIVDEHGPRAIASYLGTYTVATAATQPLLKALMQALRSPMWFTADTIDQPGKLIAKGLHGLWMAPPQGFHDADVALLLGTNPLITFAGLPNGNPGRWLTRSLARGMHLIVVDPRCTDVARRATLHIQPKPGHDVEILASFLKVIIEEGRFDTDFVANDVTGLDALRRAVAPFVPSEVARRAGVDAESLCRAARIYADADRGFGVCGTGPSMSGFTTLVEYLLLDLETLCGRWLREGERIPNPGTLMPCVSAKAQAQPPYPSYGYGEKMRVRGLTETSAGMPTGALAEEILLAGDGKVRALISCCGNPVAAWPDQLKTLDAMRALDLLVQIDVRMSQTAHLAHYVIAPKMSFEVPGISQMGDLLVLYGTGYGYENGYAHYSPPVAEVPPGSDLIEEWEFCYGLAQRLGISLEVTPPGPPTRTLALDMARKPSTDELYALLLRDARVSLDEVKRHPHGAFFPEPEIRVAAKDPGWSGRLDVGNAAMLADLDTVARGSADACEDAGEFPLRLICRRMLHTYNSSMTTSAARGARSYNPAFLHPRDLERLGVAAGDVIEICSARASILGIAEADATLREGLVSMTHAFGGAPERDADFRTIGSPTSRLLGADARYERYSGQPLMSNVPVNVRPVRPA